jgi:L-fucose isomerase-like protein
MLTVTALKELYKMSKTLKVGYLPLAKASWMNPDLNKKCQQGHTILKNIDQNYEIFGGQKIIASEPDILEESEHFRREGVDVIVCFFSTFSLGSLVPLIAKKLKIPVILWSMPETPSNGGRLQNNSFCAANMNAHILWKLGIQYFHVHASPEDNKATADICKIFNAMACAKKINNMRLGVVGGRVPGFYTSCCDEMLLRKKLGVELKYITLLELVKRAELLSCDDIQPALDLISENSQIIDGPSAKEQDKSARFFTAVQKLKNKYLVDTFTMRCWPDVNENELFGIGICSTIGMLTNTGTITVCEGDVYGAVMMRIEHELTGGKPFFCDMIVMDGDFGVAWHCGAAPCELCKDSYPSKLCKSSIIDGGGKKGLTNEFPLKPGRVTLCRLSETRDGTGFRMLIVPGTGIDTDLYVRGNPLKIKFDAGCDALRKTVIEEGFEHHYSLIHGDICEELLTFCKLMNITPIMVK